MTTGTPTSERARGPHQLIRFKWWVVLFLSSLILAGSLFEAFRKDYGNVDDWTLTSEERRILVLSMSSGVLGLFGLLVSLSSRNWSGKVESVLIILVVGAYAAGSVFSTIYPGASLLDCEWKASRLDSFDRHRSKS